MTTTDIAVIAFPVTPAEIAEWSVNFAKVDFSTKPGYEEGRKALNILVQTRVAIERRRKELNEDALAHQRRVNKGAKELTAAIESIEVVLEARKRVIDDEATRVQRERDEAARIERERIENEEKARKAAEEQRVRDELAAAQKKIDEENARLEAERKRLADEAAAERRRIEEEAAAAQRERERLDREAREKREAEERVAREKREAEEAEQRRVAAAAQKLIDDANAAEAARLEAERVRLETLANEERIRREAEEAERKRLEAAREAEVREAERQARLRALLPVAQQLREWSNTHAQLLFLPSSFPESIAAKVNAIFTKAICEVDALANAIEKGEFDAQH